MVIESGGVFLKNAFKSLINLDYTSVGVGGRGEEGEWAGGVSVRGGEWG